MSKAIKKKKKTMENHRKKKKKKETPQTCPNKEKTTLSQKGNQRNNTKKKKRRIEYLSRDPELSSFFEFLEMSVITYGIFRPSLILLVFFFYGES